MFCEVQVDGYKHKNVFFLLEFSRILITVSPSQNSKKGKN